VCPIAGVLTWIDLASRPLPAMIQNQGGSTSEAGRRERGGKAESARREAEPSWAGFSLRSLRSSAFAALKLSSTIGQEVPAVLSRWRRSRHEGAPTTPGSWPVSIVGPIQVARNDGSKSDDMGSGRVPEARPAGRHPFPPQDPTLTQSWPPTPRALVYRGCNYNAASTSFASSGSHSTEIRMP